MPDISMCDSKTCTLKENCYRYTAIPCDYQSYGSFEQNKDGECDYYWANRQPFKFPEETLKDENTKEE